MTIVDASAAFLERCALALLSRGRWRIGAAAGLVGVVVALVPVLGLRPGPTRGAGFITVCKGSSCDHHTIQAAVHAANAGDTIKVLEEEHTESGILVDKSLKIAGGNIVRTVVQAAEVEGQASERVFEIAGSADVVVEDMIIRHGRVIGNLARGGGILNRGILELRRVTVMANEAIGTPGDPGGKAEGGGIYNEGTLDIVGCTVSGNEARGGDGASTGDNGGEAHGGGLFSIDGSVAVVNTTVSGNKARGGASGGG